MANIFNESGNTKDREPRVTFNGKVIQSATNRRNSNIVHSTRSPTLIPEDHSMRQRNPFVSKGAEEYSLKSADMDIKRNLRVPKSLQTTQDSYKSPFGYANFHTQRDRTSNATNLFQRTDIHGDHESSVFTNRSSKENSFWDKDKDNNVNSKLRVGDNEMSSSTKIGLPNPNAIQYAEEDIIMKHGDGHEANGTKKEIREVPSNDWWNDSNHVLPYKSKTAIRLIDHLQQKEEDGQRDDNDYRTPQRAVFSCRSAFSSPCARRSIFLPYLSAESAGQDSKSLSCRSSLSNKFDECQTDNDSAFNYRNKVINTSGHLKSIQRDTNSSILKSPMTFTIGTSIDHTEGNRGHLNRTMETEHEGICGENRWETGQSLSNQPPKTNTAAKLFLIDSQRILTPGHLNKLGTDTKSTNSDPMPALCRALNCERCHAKLRQHYFQLENRDSESHLKVKYPPSSATYNVNHYNNSNALARCNVNCNMKDTADPTPDNPNDQHSLKQPLPHSQRSILRDSFTQTEERWPQLETFIEGRQRGCKEMINTQLFSSQPHKKARVSWMKPPQQYEYVARKEERNPNANKVGVYHISRLPSPSPLNNDFKPIYPQPVSSSTPVPNGKGKQWRIEEYANHQEEKSHGDDSSWSQSLQFSRDKCQLKDGNLDLVNTNGNGRSNRRYRRTVSSSSISGKVSKHVPLLHPLLLYCYCYNYFLQCVSF